MFISVDLPAPFSPSSACTSPSSRSRSMWSFATIPGNRFVTPRSSRTGGAATGRESRGAGRRRPAPSRVPLLDRLRDALDRARLQRHELLGDGAADRGRDARAPLADPDAVVLRREDRVEAPAERAAGLRARRDRVVDRDVDLLLRAREDVRPEVGLVGVDADAHHVLLLRRVERAEAAAAGDLEDDAGAVRDL